LERYRLKKEAQLFLDYEDILQKTYKMLKSNSQILQYYQKKFKFIMVDEYQDLNYVQDGILRLLGEGTNLFVVGDKKQSIYGFRGARVELFEKLKADLESRGQSIVLKDNFRSNRRIIDFVNCSFKNIMSDYEPIMAHRSHKGNKNICFMTSEASGSMDERRNLEGEFIAKKIIQMMTDSTTYVCDRESQSYRKPRFCDFAVLLRRRTHLIHYIRAFKKYGIPFHVADTGSLLESFGVKRMLNALKAIEFRENIYLYSVLSYLFNISDDCLAAYVLKNKDLLSGLKEEAKFDDAFRDLEKAFQLLRRWCKIKDKVTLRELADIIVSDTELLPSLARIDTLEVESLYKFLDLCWHFDQQGYTLKEFLKELADFGDEQQEATEVSEEEDVVRFITIHSSKGLEFPIVILADSGQNISVTSSDILFDPELGFALREDKEKWDKLKQHLEQKELEEAKRLLYVALTRARDYLVISGEMASEKKESFLKWLNLQSAAEQEIPVDVLENLSEMMIKDAQLPSPVKTQTSSPKAQALSGQIPLLRRYSVTSIGEFARCPRKYYYSNVLGISEKIFYRKKGEIPRLSPLERGTIVHELIERIHKDKFEAMELKNLLSQTGYSLSLEDMAVIEKCLQNYVNSDIFRMEGKVFSEIPFAYLVNDDKLLIGQADLVFFEDDGATIVDFKTNTKIDSNLLEIYRLQVLTYALAISEIYNVTPKTAIIASLFEGKFIKVNTATSNLLECKDQVLNILDNIENGRFHGKAHGAIACGFCVYKDTLCKLL